MHDMHAWIQTPPPPSASLTIKLQPQCDHNIIRVMAIYNAESYHWHALLVSATLSNSTIVWIIL